VARKVDVGSLVIKTNPIYGTQGLFQLFAHLANSPNKGTEAPVILQMPSLIDAFGLLGGQFSLLSILNDPSIVFDGLDTGLGMLEFLMDSALAKDIPLLGDKLSRGADFIRSMRGGLLADLKERLASQPGGLVKITQDALWDIFGTDGLDIILDNNNDGIIDKNDVVVAWYDMDGVIIKGWELGEALPKDASGKLADAIQFDMKLGGKILGAGLDIPLDFNIPGFSLDIDGGFGLDLSWGFDFGFGLSVTDYFYLTTNLDPNDKELSLDVVAFLDGNPDTVSSPENAELFSADGQVLFFGANVVDNRPNGKASGIYGGLSLDIVGDERGRLTFDRLFSNRLTDIFKVDFGVDIDLDLKTTLSIVNPLNGDPVDGLPRLRADLVMDWGWNFQDGAKEFGIDLKNFEVDLGSYIGQFLQPIAKTIKETLDPLMPVVDAFLTEIPGLGTVGLPNNLAELINFMLKIKGYKPVDWSFLYAAKQIYGLIDVVAGWDTSNAWLRLGDITGLGTSNPGSQQNLDSGNADLAKLEGDLGAATSDSNKRSGFQVFRYLKDISNWMSLLSGGDAILFTYELPLLKFEKDLRVLLFSYGIPEIASFNVYGTAGFELIADLGFGYDTYGIRKTIDTGNPLYLLDGLFIMDWDLASYQNPKQKPNDKPEITLDAYIGVEGSIDIAIVEGGVYGKIGLEAAIDLQDIETSVLIKDADGYVTGVDWKSDGRIRGSEIYTMLTYDSSTGQKDIPIHVENLFNLDARIYLELGVFFDIILVGRTDIEIVDITLVELEYNAPKVKPTLGSVENGVLTLHSGRNAHKRQFGNTEDGGEAFYIYTDKATGGVGVEFNNFYQVFHGVTKIVAYGDNGDDTFDASRLNLDIDLEFHGGSGNDTLIAGAGRGGVEFYGGDGEDILDASRNLSYLNNQAQSFVQSMMMPMSFSEPMMMAMSFDEEFSDDNYGLDEPMMMQSFSVGDFSYEEEPMTMKTMGFEEDYSYEEEPVMMMFNEPIMMFNTLNTPAPHEYRVKLYGGAGNDNITGTDGEDYIEAGDGDDTINAGKGSDFVDAGKGANTIDGGDGDNYITFEGDFSRNRINNGKGSSVFDLTGVTTDLHIDINPLGMAIKELNTNSEVKGAGGQTIASIARLVLGNGNNVVTISRRTFGHDVFIDGGGGYNKLFIDDVGTTEGFLTGNQITGLGMGGVITYQNFNELTIGLGSNSDIFNILDTHTGKTTIESNGGADTINLYKNSGETYINTGSDSDTVNIFTMDHFTKVDLGDNNDTIYIRNQNNVLDQINARLEVIGGDGFDTMNADDTGDTKNNTGILESDRLLGLGMTTGIFYNELETVNIGLGSGSDTFTIESTHASDFITQIEEDLNPTQGKRYTNLYTGAGDDQVRVKTIDSVTSVIDNIATMVDGKYEVDNRIDLQAVNTGNDIITVKNDADMLEGIRQALYLEGGDGYDITNLDDFGDSVTNLGLLTDYLVYGYGMGKFIDYIQMEELNINQGTGNDLLGVTNSHGTETLIETNLGDDAVFVDGILGTTTIYTQQGNDYIEVGSQHHQVRVYLCRLEFIWR
jgi:hypothetical protein